MMHHNRIHRTQEKLKIGSIPGTAQERGTAGEEMSSGGIGEGCEKAANPLRVHLIAKKKKKKWR